MHVTTDPRCPQHPRHAVNIRCSRYDDGPGIWVCAACSRPLGCAALKEWALSLRGLVVASRLRLT